MSRDWISNEIFRRIEPQGRTMAEYMRQELWPILGDKAPLIGAEEHELKNYIEPKPYGKIKFIKSMW
jgi:hypothetical protein